MPELGKVVSMLLPRSQGAVVETDAPCAPRPPPTPDFSSPLSPPPLLAHRAAGGGEGRPAMTTNTSPLGDWTRTLFLIAASKVAGHGD